MNGHLKMLAVLEITPKELNLLGQALTGRLNTARLRNEALELNKKMLKQLHSDCVEQAEFYERVQDNLPTAEPDNDSDGE